jgi:hypothetical protein
MATNRAIKSQITIGGTGRYFQTICKNIIESEVGHQIHFSVSSLAPSTLSAVRISHSLPAQPVPDITPLSLKKSKKRGMGGLPSSRLLKGRGSAIPGDDTITDVDSVDGANEETEK